MHGLIFTELRRYVDRATDDGWHRVCAEAGVERARHCERDHHATAELIALVESATRVTGTAVPELLESFGMALAPTLLARFGHCIEEGWTALDVIEHAEQHCHRAVRRDDPVAHPPRLVTTRVAPHEVLITYSSYRRLCHLARGIARGILAHYGEAGTVRETGCMHRGDEACLIVVHSVAGDSRVAG